MTVEYRTCFTGVCKHKGERTARIIAFVPPGAVQIPSSQPITAQVPPGAVQIPSSQPITVQVPPGMVAGQTLRVPTPQGMQLATIPSGVSAGQTFTFLPGAPQVVQADVQANVDVPPGAAQIPSSQPITAQVPPGAVQIPSSQPITVQVPPGMVAGQTLRVPTPQGMQLATIPSGVSAGQTFTLLPGAPQVEATVVA